MSAGVEVVKLDTCSGGVASTVSTVGAETASAASVVGCFYHKTHDNIWFDPADLTLTLVQIQTLTVTLLILNPTCGLLLFRRWGSLCRIAYVDLCRSRRC